MTVAEYVHHIDPEKYLCSPGISFVFTGNPETELTSEKQCHCLFFKGIKENTLFFLDTTGSRYDFNLQSSGYRIHQGGNSLKSLIASV